MRDTSRAPLLARPLISPAERRFDPTPTNTVPGELHQICAHVDSIRTRVQYLEELIKPSAIFELTETKRIMKDTHLMMESLQRKAFEYSSAVELKQITKEAWQAYRRLIDFEGQLLALGSADRGVGDEKRPLSYIPAGAVKEQRPRSFVPAERQRTVSYNSMMDQQPAVYVPIGAHAVALAVSRGNTFEAEGHELGETVVDSPTVQQSWLEDADVDEELGNDVYLMSGALPNVHSNTRTVQNEVQNAKASPRWSKMGCGDDLDDQVIALTAITNSMRPNIRIQRGKADDREHMHAILNMRNDGFPHLLAKSPAEVEQSCQEEEKIDTPGLHDPDREREGSVTGLHASRFILSGNNDPDYLLPKLRFIKNHEVKQLKEWLSKKKYLRRSKTISRMEKLLHLLFLLQDGCRFETIAVLFSRTPRQVQDACKEVQHGLRELYCETHLPHAQPTCDHLWNISIKYFNTPEVEQRTSQYYGWTRVEVTEAIVALNMFIARFRQHGKVALIGPYWHWWSCFRDARVGGTRWN